MNKTFEVSDVMHLLGVAPSTASIIAGLLSGTVDPENFRSVEYWPLSDLDAPPQYMKVLYAISELLSAGHDAVKMVEDYEARELWYVAGFGGQPTVTWYQGAFELRSVDV
jgi:hypothetical protein